MFRVLWNQFVAGRPDSCKQDLKEDLEVHRFPEEDRRQTPAAQQSIIKRANDC